MYVMAQKSAKVRSLEIYVARGVLKINVLKNRARSETALPFDIQNLVLQNFSSCQEPEENFSSKAQGVHVVFAPRNASALSSHSSEAIAASRIGDSWAGLRQNGNEPHHRRCGGGTQKFGAACFGSKRNSGMPFPINSLQSADRLAVYQKTPEYISLASLKRV